FCVLSRAASPATCPLSLHAALPILRRWRKPDNEQTRSGIAEARDRFAPIHPVRELTLLVARDTPAIGAQPRAARARHNGAVDAGDRKSTRLNSSHEWISYAVLCLKK